MAFNIKEDSRWKQRLDGAASLLAPKDVDIPAAELPPLADIHIELPAPTPPGEAAILGRYRDRLRAVAKVTPRPTGEPLVLGDEVCVSLVGHVGGALLAGSVQSERWIELMPDSSAAGLAEQLAGVPVGGQAVVPVVLEDGRTAVFAVRIHAAQSVEMLHPESPAAVAALGLAADLDATLVAIGNELVEEAVAAAPALAMRATMVRLAEIAVVAVPPSAVDAEVQRAWRAAEGEACVALGFTVEEQQEALKLWLGDAALRAEATQRVKSYAVLRGVVERDKLDLTEQGWARFFEAMAPVVGKTAAEARAEVEKDPKMKAELEELAFRMQVVDHIMGAVAITFVE